MKIQKTITVNNEKIKMVSRVSYRGGPSITTKINGKLYWCNVQVMKDFNSLDHTDQKDERFIKEFLQRAMDKAYVSWVKEFGK